MSFSTESVGPFSHNSFGVETHPLNSPVDAGIHLCKQHLEAIVYKDSPEASYGLIVTVPLKKDQTHSSTINFLFKNQAKIPEHDKGILASATYSINGTLFEAELGEEFGRGVELPTERRKYTRKFNYEKKRWEIIRESPTIDNELTGTADFIEADVLKTSIDAKKEGLRKTLWTPRVLSQNILSACNALSEHELDAIDYLDVLRNQYEVRISYVSTVFFPPIDKHFPIYDDEVIRSFWREDDGASPIQLRIISKEEPDDPALELRKVYSEIAKKNQKYP